MFGQVCKHASSRTQTPHPEQPPKAIQSDEIIKVVNTTFVKLEVSGGRARKGY